VRNRDDSLAFSLPSNHGDVDLPFSRDIDPDHEGNELLTFVDDDNSAGGEGGELL
jgi:hypothetical protein